MNRDNHFLFLILTLVGILILFSFLVVNFQVNYQNIKVGEIIYRMRENQLLAAITVGGGLAVTGAVLQTYFNNSLASPHTLGIISLSGVGAALSIVFGLSAIYQFSFAFIGALLLFFILSYSKLKHSNIIFIGIFLNFIGESLVMWIKYLYARIEDYAAIDYWFWGSLEKVSGNALWWLLMLSICVLVIILKSSTFLDLISQGMDHHKNISFNKKVFKNHERILILMTSSIIAIATITTGKIGFIGLMAPHLAKRIAFEFNHTKLLIISFLVGANILTISLFMQILLKHIEVGKFPIGLLLSVPGIITFFYILKGRKQ